MKLIKPSFEIIEQPTGEEGIYKQIERAGRVCYKSENKITEDSYKKFVETLKSKQHFSILEHGTLYFNIPLGSDDIYDFTDLTPTWTKCRLVKSPEINWWAVTTNLRVLEEHFSPKYIKYLIDRYLCGPTKDHAKRVTVKFILSRSIAQEFTRHRVFSFAMESQRYCNYSRNKFRNEITYIIPSHCNLEEGWYGFEYATSVSINGGTPTISEGYLYFKNIPITDEEIESTQLIKDKYTPLISSLNKSEQCYFDLLNQGWTPQQAREVLPNACKTELIMTGFVSDWEHFFSLRDDKDHAHPDAYALAHPLHEEFIKRGYL